MVDSPEIESEAAAYRFLMRYLEDQEQGRTRSVEEYQDLFPDHRELVARKVVAVRCASIEASCSGVGPPCNLHRFSGAP